MTVSELIAALRQIEDQGAEVVVPTDSFRTLLPVTTALVLPVCRNDSLFAPSQHGRTYGYTPAMHLNPVVVNAAGEARVVMLAREMEPPPSLRQQAKEAGTGHRS